MKPISFKEQNVNLTKPTHMTDEDCSPMMAHHHNRGFVSCWKMTLRERIKALFTGIIWVDTLGASQPPIWLGVDTPF